MVQNIKDSKGTKLQSQPSVLHMPCPRVPVPQGSHWDKFLASPSRYFMYLQANVSQTFLSEKILVFAWASITKYHRLGGINNRNLFPHHSAGWVTVLAEWDLVRTLFLLWRWWFVLCPHAEETEWSRSYKVLWECSSHSELSTHMILFKCNYSPKGPF